MRILKIKLLTKSILILSLAATVTACSSGSSILNGFSKKEDASAAVDENGLPDDQRIEKLYNSGLEDVNNGAYKSASKKFADVERVHPYSKWATKSLLMQGFANYKARKYGDAVNACQRFISLHPGHSDTPYAYYILALAQYDQITNVERDQSQTQVALDALDEVSRRFPDSKYAGDAMKKSLQARDHLAGKEMAVGRYYAKHGDYLAGINRFKKVITDYQSTSQTPEALYRLTESYMSLGITSEAQTAAAILGHNFPDSTWYKDAYTLVASGGQAPVADSGSWMSKLFKL
jgi:outer membrane protein assembly factor BamD